MVPPAPAFLQQWWLPTPALLQQWWLPKSMVGAVDLLHINGNQPNNNALHEKRKMKNSGSMQLSGGP
jgi:hypothetical protein